MVDIHGTTIMVVNIAVVIMDLVADIRHGTRQALHLQRVTIIPGFTRIHTPALPELQPMDPAAITWKTQKEEVPARLLTLAEEDPTQAIK